MAGRAVGDQRPRVVSQKFINRGDKINQAAEGDLPVVQRLAGPLVTLVQDSLHREEFNLRVDLHRTNMR